MNRPALGDWETRILETAQQHLQKFGVKKLRLVDVAEACGITHAHIYNFYPGKKALIEAITARCLADIENELAQAVKAAKTPRTKLLAFLKTLNTRKKRMARETPGVFELFDNIGQQYPELTGAHIVLLKDMLGDIIDTLSTKKRDVSVQFVWNATLVFHHPLLIAEHLEEDQNTEIETASTLIIEALKD